MDDTSGGRSVGKFKGGLSIVQDFYLEFFGTLLPGVTAVTATILLGLGFYYFLSADAKFITAACKLIFCNWEVALLYLALSYAMGGIAYRRNTKTPDIISAYRQWKATKEGSSSEEVGRLSVSFDASRVIPRGLVDIVRYWWNREQWILRHAGHNIDYPYPHMRQYLCCRGLTYLADYVPWCAGSGGPAFKATFEKGKCSKHYVNIIKQRLRNSGRGALILDMVRNECNIRMLSSLWYILTFVRRMLMLAVVVAALAIPVKTYLYHIWGEKTDAVDVELVAAVSRQDENTQKDCFAHAKIVNCCLNKKSEARLWQQFIPQDLGTIVQIIWFFFFTFLAIALVVYCQNSIECGFHYVRTREVTMILETAWILENVGAGESVRKYISYSPCDLFADIKTLANNFKDSHCTLCKHYGQCYGESN